MVFAIGSIAAVLFVLALVSFLKIRKLNAECHRQKSELDSKSAQVEEVVAQLEGERLKLKSEEQLRQHAEAELAMVKPQLGQSQKKVNRLEDEISSCNSTIDAITEENATKKTQLEKQAVQLQVAQQRFEELMAAHQASLDELQAQKKSFENQLEEATKENQRLSGIISTQEASLDELKVKETELEAQADSLRRQIEDLNGQIEELMQQISDLEAEEENEKAADADELERTIAQLQMANEELSQCKSDLETKNSLFERRGNTIERLQNELDQAKEEIQRLKEEIEELKEEKQERTETEKEPFEKEDHSEAKSPTDEADDSEPELQEKSLRGKHHGSKLHSEAPAEVPSEENDEVPEEPDEGDGEDETEGDEGLTSNEVGSMGGTYSRGTTHQEDHEDLDVEDLPLVENEHGEVIRTILFVRDLEADDPYAACIDAKEFFSRDASEIASKSYYLNEADKRGHDAFVCGCCGKRVKISKRDYGYREVLFFAHCQKHIDCAWQRDNFALYGSGSEGELNEEELERFNRVKSQVVNGLRGENSRAKGVSDVEENTTIHGTNPYMVWRKVGVRACYGNRNMVFEFVTRNTLLNYVVDKDLFYRLNNQHVIWILGADVRAGYYYLHKHVPQNIMFANRRNVFFVDNESLAECEKRQELVLKCNYLDADDKWHYRKQTGGKNGELITLDQLQFDDDLCKPYFYDANWEYFAVHPKVREEYISTIKSREEIIRDLKEKREAKQIKSPSKDVAPKEEEKLDEFKKEPIKGLKNRYLIYDNKKCGVVDGDSNIIIPCIYDRIIPWTTRKYRVLKIDLWGVIDEDDGIILDFLFQRIGDLFGDKALVDGGNEMFYIDKNCNRKVNEKNVLQGGWVKYRCGNKWGIVDENNDSILNCKYDEIGSFRGRLIGFINGGFQKLVPRYDYRMTMQCKCERNEEGHAIFSINGVELRSLYEQVCEEGQVYSDKCICNILYNSGEIHVMDLTEKGSKKRFHSLIEDDASFDLNGTYTGKIIRIQGKRKYYIQFENGKQSYFTKQTFFYSKKNPLDYKIGSTITVIKIGFDKNYDKTLWKIL